MNLKALEKEGGRITHEKGFTHTGFQRAHGEMSEDAPRGHWRSFLCALAQSDLPLACRCCSRLREDLLGCGDTTVAVPAPLEKSARLALVPVSEKPRPPTEEADPARPAPKPKGRPRKGLEQQEPGFDLRRFLAEHRRAVYTETAGSYTKSVTYRCLACERDIKFCRTTDIEKLYKHERGATHGKGLERMGLVEAKPGAVEDKPPEADGRCHGVQPEAPTSPLRPMLGCIQRWAQAGMPRTVYAADESGPLRDATFEVSGDLVHVRSTSCSGRCCTVQHACGACLKAANAKALKSAIGARCYDMDLCELAWKALHEGMTEAELFIGAMRQQEYIVLGLAGDGLDGLARVKSPLQLAKRIRQRFESIPHRRLSASFKDYLSTHLTKARALQHGHGGSSTYSTYLGLIHRCSARTSTCSRPRARKPSGGGGIERRRLGQCSHHLLPHANEERAGATRECATHRGSGGCGTGSASPAGAGANEGVGRALENLQGQSSWSSEDDPRCPYLPTVLREPVLPRAVEGQLFQGDVHTSCGEPSRAYHDRRDGLGPKLRAGEAHEGHGGLPGGWCMEAAPV